MEKRSPYQLFSREILPFYGSGSYINHVALYIGGGQVIHSSNERTGILIAPANYRTPCKAVTFLD